jgi:heat shock protein HslJ
MTRLPLLLTIASATLLGACSVTGGSASPSPQALALDGHTYLSTATTGVTLVPGSQVTLTFKDGSLSASGGCNSMGGGYTLTGDKLTTGQMMSTEMACAEPLMKQDQWLADFLSDVTVSQNGDTITLNDGSGVTMTLQDKETATPDKPIEGTLWVLDGIVTGEAVSSVPAGVVASIRILDGKAEVKFGCNTGAGDVTVTPDTLTFGPMVMTKMACEAGPAAVEGAVTTVLQGTVAYAIDADALTLDAGANGLMFRAAP